MPHLQETQAAGAICTTFADADTAQGIHGDPRAVAWCRPDWQLPIGTFSRILTSQRQSWVGEVPLAWTRVHIPLLWLGYRAALLLLQGQPLSDILLPGHTIQGVGVPPVPAGHVLLRVDSWRYWAERPCLEGLVLAFLHEDLPSTLSPAEVLGALAADSRS